MTRPCQITIFYVATQVFVEKKNEMELWVQFTLVGLLSDVASGHWATVIYSRIKNGGKVSVEKSILYDTSNAKRQQESQTK